MSSPEKTFASSDEFLIHLQKMDTKSSHELIAQFFNRGVEYLTSSQEYARKHTAACQQITEIQAVNNELRNEMGALKTSLAELLQSSAVDKYRLSELDKASTKPQANPATSDLGTSLGGVTKSELFRIDDKFTGADKSLYPSFQRQIKIALAQNSD
ncbi:hypothetical protein K3495_g12126, partial [Podosphaera aphanis]